MRVRKIVKCSELACSDVDKDRYMVPGIDIDPEKIRIAMISEASPANPGDYLYAKGKPLQMQTTVAAFNDAGVDVSSMKELLSLGVYVTNALKCSKLGYSVSAGSIKKCSSLLEKEISLFPNVEIFMLMGDVAIKAMNNIARRQTGERVIPPGSTYKLRGRQYYFQGRRVFPSYLQAGPAFFIEKSKRRMLTEDIRAALASLGMSYPA